MIRLQEPLQRSINNYKCNRVKRVVNIWMFLWVSLVFSQDEEAFQRGSSLYNQEKYQEG